MKVGFKIYHIGSNRIIYDIEAPRVHGGFVKSNLIVFRTVDPIISGNSIYYVFDIVEGLLCQKSYSQYQIGMLNRFDHDGVIFNLNSNGTRIDKFKTSFNIVN